MPEPIKLGEKYRDTISGFEGVATARTEYLYGCVRIVLEGGGLKEDGTPKDCYFDEQRLERLDTSRPARTATSGGPQGSVVPAGLRRP